MALKKKTITSIVTDAKKVKTIILNIVVAIPIEDFIGRSATDEIERGLDEFRGVGTAEIVEVATSNKSYNTIYKDLQKINISV